MVVMIVAMLMTIMTAVVMVMMIMMVVVEVIAAVMMMMIMMVMMVVGEVVEVEAHLRQASLLGLGRHLAGVGLQHAAVLLAVLLVLRPGVALPQRPVHAHLQRLLQVPAPTHTHT